MPVVYKLPSFIPISAYAVAAFFLLLGIVLKLKGKPKPLWLSCCVLAVLIGGLLGPMLSFDTVTLTENRLEQTTGFSFAHKTKGFELDGLQSIHIVKKHNHKNKLSDYWVGHYADGSTHGVDPSDLWEIHTGDIAAKLRAKGIEVERR